MDSEAVPDLAQALHLESNEAERGMVVQTAGEVSDDGQWIKLVDWQGHKDCWMRWSIGPNESDMVTYSRTLVKRGTWHTHIGKNQTQILLPANLYSEPCVCAAATFPARKDDLLPHKKTFLS